jgi:hypothetical protein
VALSPRVSVCSSLWYIYAWLFPQRQGCRHPDDTSNVSPGSHAISLIKAEIKDIEENIQTYKELRKKVADQLDLLNVRDQKLQQQKTVANDLTHLQVCEGVGDVLFVFVWLVRLT